MKVYVLFISHILQSLEDHFPKAYLFYFLFEVKHSFKKIILKIYGLFISLISVRYTTYNIRNMKKIRKKENLSKGSSTQGWRDRHMKI